jgi:hypothetical protein
VRVDHRGARGVGAGGLPIEHGHPVIALGERGSERQAGRAGADDRDVENFIIRVRAHGFSFNLLSSRL